MKKLNVVDTRLKKEENIFKHEALIKPEAVMSFLRNLLGEDMRDDLAYLVEVNVKMTPLAIATANKELISNFHGRIMAETILSNAAGFMIVTKSVDDLYEWSNVVKTYNAAVNIVGTKLLDAIVMDQNFSYRQEAPYLFVDSRNLDEYDWDHRRVCHAAIAEENKKVELVKQGSIGQDVKTKEDAILAVAEDLAYRDREVVAVLALDEKEKPLNVYFASIGTIDSAISEPRTVLRGALLSNASKVVMMHNHPSGDLTPSADDQQSTDRISAAANIVGIELEDSLIVGAKSKEIYSIIKNERILVKQIEEEMEL